MLISATQSFLLAGFLTTAAAIAHLICIAIGAPAYRLMGAGARMARAAEMGKWEPAVMTLGIAVMLAVWAAYAFSAAGLMRPLPWMKLALVLIAAIFLARALVFPFLKAAFPDNSQTFWWVSSGICFGIGALYAYGTALKWSQL